MKRFKIRSGTLFYLLFLILFYLLQTDNLIAGPLHFEPVTKKLPDGSAISLFISGDEFFNYLHDRDGFPVGEGQDGYYYYMVQDGDNFIITTFRVFESDPRLIRGLRKVTIPSFVSAKRKQYEQQMDEASLRNGVRALSKTAGTMNNLVIYIRFNNEPDFVVQRTVYESKFNSLAGLSLRNYYKEVSYSKLDLVSFSFPGGGTLNLCYTDPHPRSYYQPYNVSTNLSGYGDSERAGREHELLANAIEWATSNYALPDSVNFDINNDGIFDNVCFIIRGTPDGWSSLLWPHRWVLYTQTVKINGLKVYGYTLQMESVSVGTLSHEMFHALGAPDLYHYDNSDSPVGPWDIMATGSCHPGAWMKYKYGGWIDSIPIIRESGTYKILPLSREKNNCYLVKSPYLINQFFVLEFRKKTGSYEGNIPASGIIIERIDTRYHGNSSGPPDEIYIFRKGGGYGIGGDIYSAAFSDTYGQTAFTDISNPYSFSQEGGKTGISISNISSMGDSMSFRIDIDRPVDLSVVPVEDTKISGSWKCLAEKEFLVAVSPSNEKLSPRPGIRYTPGDTIGSNGFILQKSTDKSFLHLDLISDEPYYYTVWTIINEDPPVYSESISAFSWTGVCLIGNLPYEENFDNIQSTLPRGWKSASGNSGWQLNRSSPFSSPNSILLLNPEKSTDEWFYTPGFELLSSEKYMISFRFRSGSENISESLYLKGGIDRHIFGLNLFNLFSSTGFSFEEYAISKVVFRPPYDGPYYFGFKPGLLTQGVLIDDFKIEKVPLQTVQHSNPEEFYPNPTSGKITIPATVKTAISVFRTDGIKVFETEIESMQEVDLSALGNGIFLIRFSDSSGSVTRKIVIQ
jgi:M6 family metalloprotease-like protein